MKVHEKIRFMRESKDWSQEEMAAKLNMSVSGYSKIERGETKGYIPKLEQIAKEFDMELMDLLSFGEKHILINENGNNHSGNVIGSSPELAFENQKLHLILAHKDETIDHLRQDIARLTDMLELYKKVTA
ncbi:MAG: helix-turn-helix transcriptional regulator [Methylococcales bacterium]|nr:helix-turn-helix transcriptional regulator [Methylococcales bacterium]